MQRKESTKSVEEMDSEIDELLMNVEIDTSKAKGFVFDPTSKRGRPKIGEKFQITAPDELVEMLKKAGDMRGVGYQTMARIILKEKIQDYLKANS